MPHPKLVPKSPPPTLRLVSKAKPAPKNTLDEETNPGERPALPRRPATRTTLTSNDRWYTSEEPDTGIYLQRISVHPGPFWNTFVAKYYRECSTILDENPDFHFIPEHEREPGARVFWLRARFNDYWQPTLQGEGQHAERQYMDFIKNAQPEDFGTDVILMVCHNRMLDLERAVQSVKQVSAFSTWIHPRQNRSPTSSSGESSD